MQPRFFLFEDNIKSRGGHFLELAQTILLDAERRGFQPLLITHKNFTQAAQLPTSWIVRSVFDTDRMRRWSLCAEGRQQLAHGIDGLPLDSNWWDSLKRSITRMIAKDTPLSALKSWSSTFLQVLDEYPAKPRDQFLVGTCDDFTLLAIARALSEYRGSNLTVDTIFHFSMLRGRDPSIRKLPSRVQMLGPQVTHAMEAAKPHRIRCWTTTDELRRQFKRFVPHVDWQTIDYPIRESFLEQAKLQTKSNVPKRLTLAGMMRREKGRYVIAKVIDRLWDLYLKPHQLQLTMQLPTKRWRILLPRRLWRYRALWENNPKDSPLQFAPEVIGDQDYPRWIAESDLGLFVYDGARYYARCSGALLDMMSAGVPVIVPAGNWLSRQLAFENNRYLEEVEQEVVSTQETSAKSHHVWHATAHAGMELGDRFEVTLNSQSDDSSQSLVVCHLRQTDLDHYRTIELQGQDRFGHTVWQHREVLDPVDTIVRTLTPTTLPFQRLRLSLTTSYGRKALAIKSIELHTFQGKLYPRGAVGLSFSHIHELPAVFEDLVKFYPEYRHRSLAHASRCTQKHSVQRFLDRMI